MTSDANFFRRSRFSLLLAFCLLLHLTLQGQVLALDRNQWPVAPRLATDEDCRQLDSALFELEAQAGRNVNACMKQEPRFGTFPLTGEKCRPKGLQAWSQCVDQNQQWCELGEFHTAEMAKCRTYAQQNAAAHGPESSLATAMNIGRLNQVDAAAQKAWSYFEALKNDIGDPKRFLLKALHKGSADADKALIERLYPGLSSQGGKYDAELAEQLYRHAFQRANFGVSIGADKGISEIQEASLRRIDFLYAQIFSQMDTALRQMGDFDSQARALRFNEAPPREVPRRADPGIGCSILDDFSATRELQERDPQRFLNLTRRCKG